MKFESPGIPESVEPSSSEKEDVGSVFEEAWELDEKGVMTRLGEAAKGRLGKTLFACVALMVAEGAAEAKDAGKEGGFELVEKIEKEKKEGDIKIQYGLLERSTERDGKIEATLISVEDASGKRTMRGPWKGECLILDTEKGPHKGMALDCKSAGTPENPFLTEEVLMEARASLDEFDEFSHRNDADRIAQYWHHHEALKEVGREGTDAGTLLRGSIRQSIRDYEYKWGKSYPLDSSYTIEFKKK